MQSYQIEPKVNVAQEFREIAIDFSNPLDLVREAISNSFDARATEIKISFDAIEVGGVSNVLQITIEDNGEGMDMDGLQAFFDLGNSTRRGAKGTIGEKGHGTKVYFKSQYLEVSTCRNGQRFNAVMDKPFATLSQNQTPIVDVSVEDCQHDSGTKLIINGYNNNELELFNHDRLKDHIMWFTKFGSVEECFTPSHKNPKLLLKGLDKPSAESLTFGHFFPDENNNTSQLLKQYGNEAPDWYCRKVYCDTGYLTKHPHIKFGAVFYLEGKKVKWKYNNMLRRQGFTPPPGNYTVQQRYGLWLCKDFIPVQRENDWIVIKGSEYTRLHAFFNCQALKLTANRGSVENTESALLGDIEAKVKEIYAKVRDDKFWKELDDLEEQAQAQYTIQGEKKDLQQRKLKINTSKTCLFQNVTLVEPKRESGVVALVIQLSVLKPDLFPFTILDYDTNRGIDMIVKRDSKSPIQTAELFYVEYKYKLGKQMNHSFDHLHTIVCWDLDLIGHGSIVTDIRGMQRTMEITQHQPGGYTMHMLHSPISIHQIEVYVLKSFLEQNLGLRFVARSANACV